MCNIYHYIAILRHDFWPRDQTAACILMIVLVGQKAGPDNYIYLTKLRLWKLLETVQTKLWITDINFQLAWYFLWGEWSLKKVPDISVMLHYDPKITIKASKRCLGVIRNFSYKTIPTCYSTILAEYSISKVTSTLLSLLSRFICHLGVLLSWTLNDISKQCIRTFEMYHWHHWSISSLNGLFDLNCLGNHVVNIIEVGQFSVHNSMYIVKF